MKKLRILAAALTPLTSAALANPGLHAHPHRIDAPLLDLDPLLSLAIILLFWAAAVAGVEAFSRRWRMAG